MQISYYCLTPLLLKKNNNVNIFNFVNLTIPNDHIAEGFILTKKN